jgi:hypothetical protein
MAKTKTIAKKEGKVVKKNASAAGKSRNLVPHGPFKQLCNRHDISRGANKIAKYQNDHIIVPGVRKLSYMVVLEMLSTGVVTAKPSHVRAALDKLPEFPSVVTGV